MISERILQKSKENESLRNLLDLQNWVLFLFILYWTHRKELWIFQENMESFHEVES